MSERHARRQLRENLTGKRASVLAVRRLAVERGGVIARRELLEAGMSSSGVTRARASGRLFDVHEDFGVYSIVPPELLSEQARLHAALLAVPGSVVAVQSAAWRWSLIAAPPADVQLAHLHQHAAPRGVVLRRARWRPGDLAHDGTFPLTSVPRTLLDLGVRYPPGRLARALAEAEFHHAVRPADVLGVLRRGHPGSARLRKALDLHVPGYGAVRSRLERRFRRLLVDHGIPLPVRNEQVGPYRVDCLWPEQRLVVEIDGGQHERPGQAAVDADRDLWLRRHGYEVRRYSYAQVYQRGEEVVADLLAALGLGRAGRRLR